MRLILFLFSAVAALIAPASAEDAPPKPNVLFIVIDDLRDWVGYLGKNPQSPTPNIDRLAARGVSFTRSYCASPSCNPSRAALMSGMRPGTTGVYDNYDDWRKVIAPELTLNMHLRANGYEALGSGKVYHEDFERFEDWDGYMKYAGPLPEPAAGQDTGVGGIKFAPLDCKDEEMEDWKTVDYAVGQLGRLHDKPLFLACGIKKPHMPWNVPRKYYDMHPLEGIVLPPHLAPGVDLSDVPPSGVVMAAPQTDQARMLASGRWKEAVQGYLAAISYTDMLVGRLLDALDASPMKDNTIVCMWSDHGWNLGEKDHWRKFALWEETTRSPLLWVVPGTTTPGAVCGRPVDLMSVYPTLCDLCGIGTPSHVQGASIRTLLENPDSAWDLPAVTTYKYENHTVRDEGWRYIRYRNGDEELYDETADPNEWLNLAGDPAMAARKAAMALYLPADNLPPLDPKISLTLPGGGSVHNGGSKSFGGVVVGKQLSVPLTLTNTGTAALTGLKLVVSDAGASDFKIEGRPFPATVVPGGSFVFNAIFRPASDGAKKAVLKIEFDDGIARTFTINLTGKGIPSVAEMVVSQPEGHNLRNGRARTSFGPAEVDGAGVTRNYIVRNTGTGPLSKLEIRLSGPDRGDFTVGSFGKTWLRPGERTQFSVKFKASAPGARKAAIRILSEGSRQPPFDIQLSGNGKVP